MNEKYFIECCPDQLYLLDKDFNIIYCNKTAINKERIDLKNNNLQFHDVFPNSENFCELLNSAEICDSISNYEIIKKDIDGDKQIYLITGTVCQNDTTGIREYAVFIKDMTARIKEYSGQMQSTLELIDLNETLKKNQTQLIIQDKLASIGQLSAGIAHELNNPLSYIFSNLGILCSYIESFKKLMAEMRNLYTLQDINDIRNKITDLESIDMKSGFDNIFSDSIDIKNETAEGMSKVKKIINSLAYFSQKNVLMKYDLLNINKSIDEMLTVTKNEYKYNIDVITEYGDIPEIYCMSAEINQVLLDIFINSIESINRKGKDLREKIIIKTYEKNKFVYIEIIDSGEGISDKIKNRIFDPFFTTKKVGEGIGIGLTIVYEIIVNNHQGSLDFQSSEKGTTVTVGLPCIEYLEEK